MAYLQLSYKNGYIMSDYQFEYYWNYDYILGVKKVI